MWAFIVAFLVMLVGCSSGGGSTSDPAPTGSSTPSPTGVIWGRSTGSQESLFRSQTDGSGPVTLADEPGVRASFSKLAGSLVVYQTQTVPFSGADQRDIWKVSVSGTGRQVLANAADDEVVRDVVGSRVVYDQVFSLPSGVRLSDLTSVVTDGSARQPIGPAVRTPGSESIAFYEGSVAGRVVYRRNNELHSILPDGSDPRPLVNTTSSPSGQFTLLGMQGAVGTSVIYSALLSSQVVPDLYAVPVNGGAIVPLSADPDNDFLGGVSGNRVVYHRCNGPCDLYSVSGDGTGTVPLATDPGNEFVGEIVGGRIVYTQSANGQTDIYSVNADGTNTVPLATSPSNEEVVGAVGSRVIFRRTVGGLDNLYSIQADGSGGEIPLATFAEDDSFGGVVGSRVIFERVMGSNAMTSPRALYSVQADGTGLVQLTPGTSLDEFAGAAGGFACFERTQSGQRDLLCVPADGSAPAAPIAATSADEYFIVGL
ncbi:MAG: exported protein of unknown function [Nitrospira sp.]